MLRRATRGLMPLHHDPSNEPGPAFPRPPPSRRIEGGGDGVGLGHRVSRSSGRHGTECNTVVLHSARSRQRFGGLSLNCCVDRQSSWVPGLLDRPQLAGSGGRAGAPQRGRWAALRPQG